MKTHVLTLPNGSQIDMVQLPPGTLAIAAHDKRMFCEKYGPAPVFHMPALWMSRHLITWAQFDSFLQEVAPSMSKSLTEQSPAMPVAGLDFYDALRFARWVSARFKVDCRLPNEQEWEYAARAGTHTRYYWGELWNVRMANAGSRLITPVDAYPPNPWGLYDMLGNVMEYVIDPWDGFNEPDTLLGAEMLTLRGGCYGFSPAMCTCASQFPYLLCDSPPCVGFRLVITSF